jgi:hypothetical protein
MVLNMDDKALRKYLLGDMSQEEQEALELWLMSDQEAYDLLVAAEDDLIDDSLGGRLDRHELERFNNYFLAAPERKRKLQFGHAFHKFLNLTHATPGRVEPTRFSLSNFLRYRPVFAYAGFALTVVIAVVGLWVGYRVIDLQRQLDSATVQLEEERTAFQKQLNENKVLEERLLQAMAEARESQFLVKSAPAPEMLLAVNLMPGISRSSTDVPNITIPSRTQLVQFSLILLDDDYQAYRVALQDDSGKELWTRARLSGSATAGGKAVLLNVPTDRLATGDYSFRLSGLSDSNPPENLGTYHFHVLRK